jgi:GT2 family glycosyltransferase
MLARSLGVRTVTDENVGYGSANNRGAALARGQWLVFLNPDTIAEPGWLDALLSPLSDRGGLATGKIILDSDPSRLNAAGNAVHLSGLTVCRSFGAPVTAHAGRERLLAASGAALAIDRESFELLGGFDEEFFMYLEDTDLSLRAALAGLPCWYQGGSRVRHKQAPRFSPRKMYWLERNRWVMVLKVWSLRTLLSLVPSLLVIEALTWAYAIGRGSEGIHAKLAAWGWLLSHPWNVARRRRNARRLCRIDDAEVIALCERRLFLDELIPNRTARRTAELALNPTMVLCDLLRRVVLRTLPA